MYRQFKRELKYFPLILIAAAVLFTSCGDKDNKEIRDIGDVAYSPEKDKEIQQYNIDVRKERTETRTDCDTISLMEFIINTYPEGTYLVSSDAADAYSIPQPAVIYYDNGYIFAVIARSRQGERLIETKNIIGFDESYIDYDSTKLGTAFFDLVLLRCSENSFSIIWEAAIPSHGGLNKMTLSQWGSKAVPRITVNFYTAHKKGIFDYNYYLINGLTEPPHLMMTYSGINFKRTEADINRDEFPDYYEHIYYDLENRIIRTDSVAFVWKPAESVYMSVVNRKQTRPY